MHLMLNDRYERMPWELVDAVVFDVGNVLLTFDPQALLEEHFPGDKALQERLMVKVLRSPYWVMMDHGTLYGEEAVTAMCGLETDLAPAVRHFLNSWVDLKEVVPEGLRALESCRAHGKKTYVLSNYADAPFRLVENKFDFFSLFDGKIVSSQVGLIKPDHAIYSLLMERYGLTPERTLFIDDAPANIEAALSCGWQGVCYNRKGVLDRFFSEA
ncbi:MAG: HAD family phosphatase [Clostridia bacterium]|nr:HAD family phosphatase [Clostridia bacterium]